MHEHATSHPSRAHDDPQPGALIMRSTREAGVHVVALAGELDLAGADGVERELLRVEAGDARHIVLDLRELEFIDSSGLRVVYEASGRARADGDRFTIRRAPSGVQRLFVLTDLDNRLPFVD